MYERLKLEEAHRPFILVLNYLEAGKLAMKEIRKKKSGCLAQTKL